MTAWSSRESRIWLWI